MYDSLELIIPAFTSEKVCMKSDRHISDMKGEQSTIEDALAELTDCDDTLVIDARLAALAELTDAEDTLAALAKDAELADEELTDDKLTMLAELTELYDETDACELLDREAALAEDAET